MDQAIPGTVGRLLEEAAALYGDRPAIRRAAAGGEENHSYRQFYADSLAAAKRLAETLPAGSHAALIGKNTYACLVFLNAAFLAGLVAVPLGENLPAEELGALLRDSDAAALFTDKDEETRERLLALAPGVARVFTPGDMPVAGVLPKGFADRGEPESPAAIFYTSGTTGGRKGAVLTHRALVSNVYFKEMSFEGGHTALCVLPMHHIFCFSCDYLKNLKDGVTVCLSAGPAALKSELLRFEPTLLRLVPMMADGLLRRTQALRRRDPSLTPRAAAEAVFGRRLRNIIVSGASYAAEADRAFSEMGITVRQGYGMTETGPRIAVPDGATSAASGGRIISICRVRLQNGEIQVKSPSLMSGYYKQPEATAAVFTEDGWFRTGDLGRVTPDGELFITGRLKNVIILGNGENISPEEIETAYRGRPEIAEIEVFEEDGGISAEICPDPALLKANGEAGTLALLQRIVATQNAAGLAIRAIDRVYLRTDPLPKTETGKIKRRRHTP